MAAPRAAKRLQKAIEVVDFQLNGREYLLGSGFSAADISVGYSLHLAQRFVALERFHEVSDYYRKLSGRPAFKASLPEGWERPLGWLREGLAKWSVTDSSPVAIDEYQLFADHE